MTLTATNFWSCLLGIALGTGYLTSLRIIGPIGLSEILILLVICYLWKRNPKVSSFSKGGGKNYLKVYLFFSTLIVLPLSTLFNAIILGSIYSDPIYIISFSMGILLVYLVQEGMLRKHLDMGIVAFWFSIIFILTNWVTLTYLYVEKSRYTGGANNPNQLLFYAASLNLLLVMYQKKWSILLLPLVVYITLKSKSDAYELTLFIIGMTYIYLKFITIKRFSIGLKVLMHTILICIAFFLITMYFGTELQEIWYRADEGDARVTLMTNAFLATLHSPLIGFGAGSFSGLFEPFKGLEAHNNFLDFSMQFGFIFPIILYYYILKAFVISLQRNEFLLGSFILGFLVSGLFHFSGRHFIFWVELAALMNYSNGKKFFD